MVGPIPAEPLTPPSPGKTVDFADGSSIGFDDDGRPHTICPDAALCPQLGVEPPGLDRGIGIEL